MNLLITGNLGYIGPVMTQEALASGHGVVGLDVGFFKDCKPKWIKESVPDRQITKDIREVTKKDFQNIDAIIHLAALSNDPLGDLNPDLTMDINFHGTMHLAKLAKEAGVKRFVFASSCSVYGAGDKVLDEMATTNPLSVYAVSKLRAEMGLSLMADKDFCPIFMRNATAYGLSPRMRFDLVVNNMMATAFSTGKVKVLSDGMPWRPLAHVQDICRAAVGAAERDENIVRNKIFNVGNGNVQVKEIANTIARTLEAKVEITGATGHDPRSYQVSFAKLNEALPGHRPIWGLMRGVDQLSKAMHADTYRDIPFTSRNFHRIKHIVALQESGIYDKNLWPRL